MQYPKLVITGLIGLCLLTAGLGRLYKYPSHVPSCFTQIERRTGWEQREITCNYRPDSASHEWKTIKTLEAVNDTNPFEVYSRSTRRRFGR